MRDKCNRRPLRVQAPPRNFVNLLAHSPEYRRVRRLPLRRAHLSFVVGADELTVADPVGGRELELLEGRAAGRALPRRRRLGLGGPAPEVLRVPFPQLVVIPHHAKLAALVPSLSLSLAHWLSRILSPSFSRTLAPSLSRPLARSLSRSLAR